MLSVPSTWRISRRRALLGASAALFGVGVSPSPGSAAEPQWFSSLVWGVFENQSYDRIRYDYRLEAHRKLEEEGALLTRYSAATHPSGPNYRVMVSGRTWGPAETVGEPDSPRPRTVGEALAGTAPVHIYHLAGTIAPRHNPFVDLGTHISRTGRSMADFLDDLREEKLPRHCLVYVGWDDANDMHVGGDDAIRQGDDNLRDLVAALGASRWFITPDDNGLYPALFITYDEDDGQQHNHVWACWWGVGVRHGQQFDGPYSHYSFCRTVTDNWGLVPLGDTAATGPMKDVFAGIRRSGVEHNASRCRLKGYFEDRR